MHRQSNAVAILKVIFNVTFLQRNALKHHLRDLFFTNKVAFQMCSCFLCLFSTVFGVVALHFPTGNHCWCAGLHNLPRGEVILLIPLIYLSVFVHFKFNSKFLYILSVFLYLMFFRHTIIPLCDFKHLYFPSIILLLCLFLTAHEMLQCCPLSSEI